MRQVPEHDLALGGAGSGLPETILLHLPMAVVVLDRNLRFVMDNSRAAQINGVDADAHCGRYLLDVLPAMSRSLADKLAHVVETDISLIDYDADGVTPARPGQRRIRGSYYPIFDKAGEPPSGITAVFDELTDPAATPMSKPSPPNVPCG